MNSYRFYCFHPYYVYLDWNIVGMPRSYWECNDWHYPWTMLDTGGDTVSWHLILRLIILDKHFINHQYLSATRNKPLSSFWSLCPRTCLTDRYVDKSPFRAALHRLSRSIEFKFIVHEKSKKFSTFFSHLTKLKNLDD